MARWLAYRPGGQVLGAVEGKDVEEARLQAWARWGASVARVESQASEDLYREGLDRIERDRRREEDGA